MGQWQPRRKIGAIAASDPVDTLKRTSVLFLSFVFCVSATAARAQWAPAPTTPVHDASPLKPPAGARVAIVEFEDMECPDCARANPLLKEASEKYHIPWIRHDFPLPMHVWSFQAAVDARWFDTKSKKIGDAFRDAVFANQASIQTPEQLRAFAENFATEHHLSLPFVVDPQGKLTDSVNADKELGGRVGIEHTPTIWIVTNKKDGVPYAEVVDRSRLYEMIDQAIADTAHEAGHAKSGTHHAAAH